MNYLDLQKIAHPYEDDLVAFLQDLVRIRSVNGRYHETAVAQRIIAEAKKLNLTANLVASDPERLNAVVSWGEGKVSFALIGHMDTVSEGDEKQWSSPPFAAEVHNGRIIGRGTADNKAGIACGLYTLALLRDNNMLDPAQVKIILASVVDEESGADSELGVRYLLDEGYLPVQGAIYTYASDIICIGHRGLLRLELTAHGRSIHTGSQEWSQKEGGVNAVTGLAAILLALEELDLPTPTQPGFEDLSCTITPGTLFSGGEFESIVPAKSTALVDIRLMPGQPVEDVLTAVQKTIDDVVDKRPGLMVNMRIKNKLPGTAVALDHPLVKIAQKHTKRFTGGEWPVAGAGPANEGYMLIDAGIPTLPGFGPTGGNAHAPDEWVEITSLSTTVAMYSGIIQDYCTSLT